MAEEIGNVVLPALSYLADMRSAPDHFGNFAAPAKDLDRQLFAFIFIGRIAPAKKFRVQGTGHRKDGNARQIRLKNFAVSDVNLNTPAHRICPFLESGLEKGRTEPDTG